MFARRLIKPLHGKFPNAAKCSGLFKCMTSVSYDLESDIASELSGNSTIAQRAQYRASRFGCGGRIVNDDKDGRCDSACRVLGGARLRAEPYAIRPGSRLLGERNERGE